MKKVLAIAVITLSLAACNNSGKGDENKDTTTTVTKMGDTVTKVTDMDTTVHNPGDTTIKKTVDTDTTKMKKK